jgi:excisionase family DNA binding protein
MTIAAYPKLLTVAQVARRLNVSEITVRRRIRAGELPAVQLGGPKTAIRVAENELAAWLFAEQRDAA